MGCDVAIEVMPVEPNLSAVSEAEVAAYWAAHGEGPLPPELQEAVRHAVAATRLPPDPVPAALDRFYAEHERDRSWWERSLEATALSHGVTPLSEFQGRDEGARWFDAAEALRTVRMLRPLHPEFAPFLDALGAVLEAAGTRRFRMLAMW